VRVCRRQDSIRTRFLDTPPLPVLHVEYLSLLPRTRIYNLLALPRQGKQPRPISPSSHLRVPILARQIDDKPSYRAIVSLKHICGPVFPFIFWPCVFLFSPDRLKAIRATVLSFVSLVSYLPLLLSPFLLPSPNGLHLASASCLPATASRLSHDSRLDPPFTRLSFFCPFSISRDCGLTFFPTHRQAIPDWLLSICFPVLSRRFHSGGSPVEPNRREDKLLIGCLSLCPRQMSDRILHSG